MKTHLRRSLVDCAVGVTIFESFFATRGIAAGSLAPPAPSTPPAPTVFRPAPPRDPMPVITKPVASVISAVISGLIVLAVITAVLVLQTSSVRDSESALDTTSSAIRSKVVQLISVELASLLSLVFVDAMQLAQQLKVSPPTKATFEDEALFADYVRSIFPFVFDDGRIDSMNGTERQYKEYIGVVHSAPAFSIAKSSHDRHS